MAENVESARVPVPDTQPRVAVLGAGAVGCFLGGMLDLAGYRPTLLGRGRSLGRVPASGLSLLDVDGSEYRLNPEIVLTDDLADVAMREQEFDIVLLTVKAYGVEAALPTLARLVGDRGCVVTLQNGVGSDQLVLDVLGRDRVVPASLTVSVGWEDPGRVRRFSRSGGLAWSRYDRESQPPASEVLEATGLKIRRIDSADSLRWSKLLLNSMGAAQSALLDRPVSAIVSDPRLFRFEQRAYREIVGVLREAGIELVDLPGYPVRIASMLMELPSPAAQAVLARRMGSARGERSPGLRADLQRGGPTENPYLAGAVVELGCRVGKETPMHARLYDLLTRATESPALRESFRNAPDRLLAELAMTGTESEQMSLKAGP